MLRLLMMHLDRLLLPVENVPYRVNMYDLWSFLLTILMVFMFLMSKSLPILIV